MSQREEFIKSFVIDKFGLTEKEVLGIQKNGMEAFFDMAFRGPGPFGQFLERCKSEDLGPFQVESMEHRNHRVVIVNMFDMNLPDEFICRFLERYARVVSGPRYRRDAYGFWNGHRVFDVLLRESDHGFEGFLHPPALCMVEGVKGHVMCSRQPPFCRRCMEVGHNNAECESVVCHNSDAAREGAGQQQRQRPAEEAASAGRKEEEEPGGVEVPGGAQEAGAGPTSGPAEAGGPTPGPVSAEQPGEEHRKEGAAEKEAAEPESQGRGNGPGLESAGPSVEERSVPNTDLEQGSLDGMETADEGSVGSSTEEPMEAEAISKWQRGRRGMRRVKATVAVAGERSSRAKLKAHAKERPAEWAEEVDLEFGDSEGLQPNEKQVKRS
ncbi:hypothetical protein SKAU_G00387120 [Synaphobranchus kaupii]|uniref:Zinc finger CCHC domain-containing protein n=1 Tax=Synaphobranchus kaupii TaxID=118154 RepID=A0A9Q1ICE9_SYNKA|nr:hypothetical protein SKAU_G00387120 [Synaphobranchus kaupii]